MIDANSEKLIRLLNGAGYQAYAVGGCVRDALLGRPVHDIDICTAAPPEETERVLTEHGIHYIETGIKHGTVSAVPDKKPYEITTFRTDGAYLDNRRPESVTFVADLASDLARRDFTVNAMVYHPDSGVTDLFGGKEDLQNKMIRTVGDADTRFQEDALRIMRALRFASELGFTIEEKTGEAVLRNKELLNNIAAERIFSELKRLLVGRNAEQVLLEFREVFGVIIPELKPCFDLEQNTFWHQYDVYTHTVKALGCSHCKEEVRFALLLHDIGKADTKTTDENGNDHFYGHAALSAEKADVILRRFHASNKFRETVVTLIKYHDYRIGFHQRKIKIMLNRLGREVFFEWLDVRESDIKAHSPAVAEQQLCEIDKVRQLAERILKNNEPYRTEELAVNGRDLLTIGFKGRAVQDELNRLLSLVWDSPELNCADKLRSIAEKDYQKTEKKQS